MMEWEPLVGRDADDVEITSNDEQDDSVLIDDAIDMCEVGVFHYVGFYTVGLVFMADSMEASILSFLAVSLTEEWNLSRNQAATLTALVFAGEILGAVMWGRLGDAYGRRPILMAAAITICVAGVWTALANDFATLVVARFAVGVGVGGLTVPYDVFAEFLPKGERGVFLNGLNYFWSAGSALVAVFAYATLAKDLKRWRTFVLLCAVPSFFSAVLCWIFVPESPRWLLSRGREKEAMDVLKKIARWNRKANVYKDEMTLRDSHETENTSFAVLLSPKWRYLNLSLWGAWFGTGVSYFGVVLAITRLFAKSTPGETVSFDFNAIFMSTFSEFVGVFVSSITVERVGRIPSLVTFFSLSGVAVTALLFIDPSDTSVGTLWLKTVFAFMGRCFELNANCVLWITTSEVLPTEIRATGHSIASAVSRVGAVLASYVVEGNTTLHQIAYVMMFVHVVDIICSALLPETKGRILGHVR